MYRRKSRTCTSSSCLWFLVTSLMQWNKKKCKIHFNHQFFHCLFIAMIVKETFLYYIQRNCQLNSMKQPVNWTSSFNNLQNLKLIDIYSEILLLCDLILWDRISNEIATITSKIGIVNKHIPSKNLLYHEYKKKSCKHMHFFRIFTVKL